MKCYKNQIVKVYDGDFVGWTHGTLAEKCIEFESMQRWTIKTLDGTNLVRLVKENYTEFRQDGCGYVLKDGYIIEAKINFNTWKREEFYESWDQPEYFRKLFESNKNTIYKFKYDGKELWELIEEDDEREGTLFYTNELTF